MSASNQTAETEGRHDKDLIRRYVEERSEAAFAELRRRYARLIYSTCLRETGDRTLAEDASQGVFLLLSQKAGALKRHDNLAGWLYTASRWTAKNLVKQERRRQMHEAQAAVEITLSGGGNNPLWEQIEPHFHDALDRLKPADRDAVLLRFVQEQSLGEVGVCLGISENTARMRVNRALEKIRAHLGKAGVVVTLAALAVLLEARAAQAAPAALLQSLPSIGNGGGGGQATLAHPKPILAAVRETRWQMAARSALLPTLSLVFVLLITGGYRLNAPRTLNPAERQRLFQTLAGNWKGRLEFADDLTHQHFTYPTTVFINAATQGNALQFTARYEGAASVDVTTFTRDASTGQFLAQNGGPQSSHQLDGRGDFVRLRDGSYAFQGVNLARDNAVRIRITTGSNTLTMQEEYRASAFSPYQFRNRFTLQR